MGVYKRGKTYWIAFSVEGRQFRESARTGRKAEAKAVLAKRELEVFEGRFFPERRRSGLTVAGLRDLWLRHAKGKKSIEADRQRFGAIVDQLGAHTPIMTVNQSDIRSLLDRLEATITRRGVPMAPSTVNRHLALLRAALKQARAEGHQHRDPMRGIKMLDEDNVRDRICDPAEYDALLDEANPRLRLAIILAHHTAMRLGEICNLKWEQVDLAAKLARDVCSKRGKPRTVPLNAQVIKQLRAYPRNVDDTVVGSTSANLSPQFGDLVRKLRRRELKQHPESSRFDDLKFHDLRHGAATKMRRAGVDIVTVKKILGHKSWATMERYQTVSDDDLHEALRKVERASST